MLGDRGREPAKSAAWAPLTADCARRGGAESGSQRLSGEPELLARGCDARVRDDDGALEDLGAEEGLHQLVVGAVAEHLGLDADRAGVLSRVRRALAGQPAFEDPFGGPPEDAVGCNLDLEHAVGNVLAHARAGQARVAGGALERFEFASALVDGDGAGL